MFYLLEFLLVFLVLSLSWVIKKKRKYHQFPPGPPILPIIGSIPFIPRSKYPALAFEKLTQKYGDVVHVKLGFQDAIIFNSYDAVKKIIAEDKASARKADISELTLERTYRRNLGLIFSNYEPFTNIRRFTIRTLRNFGFGKASSMDVVMNEEFDKLVEQIKSQSCSNPEGGIQGEHMFDEVALNIIWRLVTGVELELGNEKTLRVLKLTNELFQSADFVYDFSMRYPFIWHMFPKWSKKTEQMICIQNMFDFGKDLIEEHTKSGVYKVDPQCYIDVFLAKIDEEKNDPNSDFIDDQLLLCIIELFEGGAETSSHTLSFAMLHMLLNPKVQEKVWQEIDSKIMKDEMIKWETKMRLPYTHATLLEVYRISNVTPFTPVRMATEDFYFKGYLIKKGIAIMPNLQSANMCKIKWSDPHNFRPDRFLADDGTVDSKIASCLVNFGDGKRICPGKNVAESSTFIYFASLMRKFKLEKVPGQPDPSVEPSLGMTYSPQPFQVKFIPRE